MNDLNAFTGLVRRCVEDYDMIAPGDTVAVGVSGGKDSLVLLLALNELRRYYPKPFSLEAITVELGFKGMDFTPVAELCASLGVPYTRLKTDIKEVVFDVRKEDNPCSLCAKMRRGALCTALSERGITKLALGHHFDDAVETFLLLSAGDAHDAHGRGSDPADALCRRGTHHKPRKGAGASDRRKSLPGGPRQQTARGQGAHPNHEPHLPRSAQQSVRCDPACAARRLGKGTVNSRALNRTSPVGISHRACVLK